MMRLIDKWFREWYKQAGASEQQISIVEALLEVQFPGDYKNLLRWSNGGEGQLGNTYVSLWAVEELVQLNEDYKIGVFLPDVVCIGTDGGPNAFCLDYATASGRPSLIQAPLGGLGRDDVLFLGDDFTSGLQTAISM